MPVNKESIPIRKECFEKLQNREYLANYNASNTIRKRTYLIFKPSFFWFSEAPSVATTEPS
jgi:hypothetical protein